VCFGRFGVCCRLCILICRCVWLFITVSVSVVCLRCLGWRFGMARRMMNGRRQGAGARGRPQGWGCGGGTIRAHVPNIYMNLCERAKYICFRWSNGGQIPNHSALSVTCRANKNCLKTNALRLCWIFCEDKSHIKTGFYSPFYLPFRNRTPRRGYPHCESVP